MCGNFLDFLDPFSGLPGLLGAYCCRINTIRPSFYAHLSSAVLCTMDGNIPQQQGSHNSSCSSHNSSRIRPTTSIPGGQPNLKHSSNKEERKERRAALERNRYWRWVDHTCELATLSSFMARNVQKERQRARDKWRRLGL